MLLEAARSYSRADEHDDWPEKPVVLPRVNIEGPDLGGQNTFTALNATADR